MRCQEGKLGNSSNLLEIHRDGSLETYTKGAGWKYPRENRGMVSVEHEGAEVAGVT